MNIQVIVGTTREGRQTERVAHWVASQARQHAGFDVELVDLADYDLPLFAEPISPRYNPDRRPLPAVQRWLDKVAAADGYIIVTPEYNHSIPAALKNALDYLDSQIAKKPVAIVSHGAAGGTRAAEHLKNILVEVKAAVVPEAVAFMGRPGQALSATGEPTAELAPFNTAALDTTLTELAWWTATLAAGRAATMVS
ncbi:MAG TPA: NAD(P)H-dependent oxidoreductase [Candidatus Saccharimonadia bacterium]